MELIIIIYKKNFGFVQGDENSNEYSSPYLRWLIFLYVILFTRGVFGFGAGLIAFT